MSIESTIASTASTPAATSPRETLALIIAVSSSVAENCRVQNPTKHTEEDDDEENRSKSAAGGVSHVVRVEFAFGFVSIFLFADISQYKPILYSAAALQDIRIDRGFIAFAENIG